jgi:hypothetical protein
VYCSCQSLTSFFLKKSCIFLYVPISLSPNSNTNTLLLYNPRSQAIEAMEISEKLAQYYKFSNTPSVGQDNRPWTRQKISCLTKLHALLSIRFFLKKIFWREEAVFLEREDHRQKKQFFFFFSKSFGERERLTCSMLVYVHSECSMLVRKMNMKMK